MKVLRCCGTQGLLRPGTCSSARPAATSRPPSLSPERTGQATSRAVSLATAGSLRAHGAARRRRAQRRRVSGAPSQRTAPPLGEMTQCTCVPAHRLCAATPSVPPSLPPPPLPLLPPPPSRRSPPEQNTHAQIADVARWPQAAAVGVSEQCAPKQWAAARAVQHVKQAAAHLGATRPDRDWQPQPGEARLEAQLRSTHPTGHRSECRHQSQSPPPVARARRQVRRAPSPFLAYRFIYFLPSYAVCFREGCDNSSSCFVQHGRRG